MAPENLAAIGAAGFHDAVGMEDDLPAPAMDTRFMMQQRRQCVEVASTEGVTVRDTADRDGVTPTVPVGAWRNFTASLK